MCELLMNEPWKHLCQKTILMAQKETSASFVHASVRNLPRSENKSACPLYSARSSFMTGSSTGLTCLSKVVAVQD